MLFKLSCTRTASFTAGLAVIAMGMMLGAPADAGEIYSWQTEDGEAAFADDPKKIPARYRDQVSLRDAQRLGDYERFTTGVGEPTSSYSEQLAARLDHLRRVNVEPRVARSGEGDAQGIASIRVQGMNLRVNGGDPDDPLIVEEVRVISSGQVVSRHDTVVRQGDRTLAIVRGHQSGEVHGVSNIFDEEDLESYE
jgi:hypothetical protein